MPIQRTFDLAHRVRDAKNITRHIEADIRTITIDELNEDLLATIEEDLEYLEKVTRKHIDDMDLKESLETAATFFRTVVDILRLTNECVTNFAGATIRVPPMDTFREADSDDVAMWREAAEFAEQTVGTINVRIERMENLTEQYTEAVMSSFEQLGINLVDSPRAYVIYGRTHLQGIRAFTEALAARYRGFAELLEGIFAFQSGEFNEATTHHRTAQEEFEIAFEGHEAVMEAGIETVPEASFDNLCGNPVPDIEVQIAEISEFTDGLERLVEASNFAAEGDAYRGEQLFNHTMNHLYAVVTRDGWPKGLNVEGCKNCS